MAMAMTSNGNWRPASEDSLSTVSDSGSDDINSQGPPRNNSSSEYMSLRFPHIRRIAPTERKKIISGIAVSLLAVGSIVGIVHFSGANASTITKTDHLKDHEVLITDLTDSKDYIPLIHHDKNSNSKRSSLSLASNEGSSSEDEVMQGDQAPQPPNSSSQPPNASRRRSRKKSNRNRNNVNLQSGPRPLPVNATHMHAMSLLNQMRLIHGGPKTYVTYTECIQHDYDNKQFPKGWKAVLRVNLTGAGLNPNDHPVTTFVGYGTTKLDARKRAAQNALSTLYPDVLHYADTDELREIEEFCTSNTATTASPEHGTNSTSTSTSESVTKKKK